MGRMLFLPPNQQYQSTEDINYNRQLSQKFTEGLFTLKNLEKKCSIASDLSS